MPEVTPADFSDPSEPDYKLSRREFDPSRDAARFPFVAPSRGIFRLSCCCSL